MQPVALTDAQKNILDCISSAGVVNEFLVASKYGENIDEYEAHKQTALLILKKVRSDTDEYFSKLLKKRDYQERSRGDFFQVVINHDALVGARIDLAKFMGSYYSVENNQFAYRGREKSHLNDYFWESHEEKTTDKINVYEAFKNLEPGYVYSFLEPPYPIQGTIEEKQFYFREVERLFFGHFDSEATIFEWNENSSNYFDAGKEWWGTYFYTYSLPGSDQVLGIVASTTD